MNDYCVWFSRSIIVRNGLGMSLEGEVAGVIFLCVPSVLGVLDVVTPAHCFSVANGVMESAERHLNVLQSVLSASAPAHQGWLVVAPTAEVNSPAIAWRLVRWVAVHMLSLNHIDAGDLVSLSLRIPRTSPHIWSSTRFHIQFFTLVESYAIWVCFKETKLVPRCGDRGSLDCSVFELLGIGGAARGSSPHI